MIENNKIIVVGSTNMDMVVKTGHIPVPGETVLGGDFFMNPGGKGANQAVAIARLGGKVVFVSRIGDDVFGKQSVQLFEEEGIDISGLTPDGEEPSGVALITVDEVGENSIVVAPGANARLLPGDVLQVLKKHEDIGYMLIQLEIPMDTVKEALGYARSRGIQVILNPAPVNKKVMDLFEYIDVITPNVKEAEMLSGRNIQSIEDAVEAAQVIREKGVGKVVITLGKNGAVVLDEVSWSHIAAREVATVDTTAAGDAFNGALVVALSEGKALEDAVSFACDAAAIVVTRMGAQSAMPYRKEVILNHIK